jgi:glutathione S-transferase
MVAANGRLQFGQVPALEVREGVMLTQSAAILRYVGKKTGLYPADHEAAALVDAVIDQVGDNSDDALSESDARLTLTGRDCFAVIHSISEL